MTTLAPYQKAPMPSRTAHSEFAILRFLTMFVLVPILLAINCLAQVLLAAGPLQVHPNNPRYLTDDTGRAIYLTGSHTWLNFQDGGATEPLPKFDYLAHLDFLKQHNHNFFRLWTWEGTAWTWNKPELFCKLAPAIFQRAGPQNSDLGLANDGKPKFDLTKFNEEFFTRLRERVVEADKRGIYVGVKLFEGFSVAAKSKKVIKESGGPWSSHPFHKDNNINGLDGDSNGDGQGYETHTLEIPAITRVQEAYVRKVIDAVNDLDNILYEVSNESHGGSTEWQYHWIRFIRDYEKALPKQHLIWMSFQWDGFDRGSNSNLFNSDAEIVSPANWDDPAYLKDPPVADGTKVIFLDTDHIAPPDRKRIEWMWKSFTRGHHPLLMDDPELNVKSEKEMEGAEGTRLAMGDTLRYADKMDLAAMLPTDRLEDCSTGYCLQHPGHEYLIYFPKPGQPKTGPFTISLEKGTYRVEWFDPRAHKVVRQDTIVVESGSREFVPPIDGDAVLYLKNTDDLATEGPGPGDLFREYHWTKKGPEFATGASMKPEIKQKEKRLKAQIDVDLKGAIRAEMVVEHWTGHFGTSGKAVQVNSGPWLELPLPQGTPGLPEHYIGILSQSAFRIPLTTLRDGANHLVLRCDRQLTRYPHYSAFGVYGITLRIYYDQSIPHSTGKITSPLPNASIGDHPVITVETQNNPSVPIDRVEVLAEYEDFDWEGNGVYRQWHYEYHFAELINHVGSATKSPFKVTWNTQWVADQERPIRLSARVTDANGLITITPVVEGLRFARDRSVRMYKSSGMPEGYRSQKGKPETCQIDITDDLKSIRAARIIVSTHGPHDEPGELGLNEHSLETIPPTRPHHGVEVYAQFEVPTEILRTGENTFHAVSATETHPLAIMWPGPVLFVEFAKNDE